jgi:hypothetical protein
MKASGLTAGRAARALAVPVVGGIAWMVLAGAPTNYILINSASLVLALALALLMPFPRDSRILSSIPWLCLCGLWVCALFGAEMDGMRRWFSLGSFRLHAGYLLLPVLIVLIAEQSGARRNLLLVLAAMSIAAMPDYGVGAGLLLVAIGFAWQTGMADRNTLGTTAVITTCLVIAIWRDQPLPPVDFVEGFKGPPGILIGIYVLPVILALLMLSLWPVRLGVISDPRAKALAFWWLGTLAAAPFGPFPWLLIGFGAAPILGLGLALAALRRQ